MSTDWVFGKRLLVRLNIVWTDSYAKRMGGWLCCWIGWLCQPIASLAAHIECLAVPTECVAGCAHCLKVWQYQSSEWLAAHVASMDVSDNYREAGCAHRLNRWLLHCLNRWLLQLSGWQCQLAERPPVPTGRTEMPVPDFEHTLQEPLYAGRHAWGNCCL